MVLYRSGCLSVRSRVASAAMGHLKRILHELRQLMTVKYEMSVNPDRGGFMFRTFSGSRTCVSIGHLTSENIVKKRQRTGMFFTGWFNLK